MNLEKIVNPLLNWFQENKRDLPWRHTNDSYKIWISEIMLQQTRVEAVKDYYLRFINSLPTLESLANVEEDKLLKLWEGLGYYTRARNLKKCAETLINQKETELPRNYEELMSLAGIGPYTAASIGSIAYGLKTPAIDGNVLRVMTRLHEDNRNILDAKVRKDYFELLSKIMPEDTRNFTEGLMELGALVCLPNSVPNCESCPLKKFCQSRKNNTFMNFPVKTKAKARKVVEKTIFILEYQGKIAISKRPEIGLLASLYEFPNIDQLLQEENLLTYLEERNWSVDHYLSLKTAKHIFSHVEWNMIGYHLFLKKKPEEAYLWVNRNKILQEYSIPEAFSKYKNSLKI